MTSEQAMLGVQGYPINRIGRLLILVVVAVCGLTACESGPEPLPSPYATRRVWAIAPLRNESGSLHADGFIIADHLGHQLARVSNLDVLPVNRTIAAMQTMKIDEVSSPPEAIELLKILGADALVVGTVIAYDPYDPPKLGLAIELYADERLDQLPPLDLRRLTRSATSDQATLPKAQSRQPVTTVSARYDAASPEVRESLQQYAADRGRQKGGEPWEIHRLSMDLYTGFVSWSVCQVLMEAEARRITPSPPNSAP